MNFYSMCTSVFFAIFTPIVLFFTFKKVSAIHLSLEKCRKYLYVFIV